MTTTLSVQKRSAKPDAARAAGNLPAVVYGPKQESIAIECAQRDFEQIFATAGESTIITLTGLDEELEVLVHDVAFNPERGGYQHVDFYAIERGKELTTNVALSFVGEAPVEKSGAMVNKALQEITVTCRPSVLPAEIEVDLSVFVDESVTVTVADLNVPEGVTVNTDAEAAVASVAAAREEEPETVEGGDGVDMDAVEVEAKGKEDGEAAPEEAPTE